MMVVMAILHTDQGLKGAAFEGSHEAEVERTLRAAGKAEHETTEKWNWYATSAKQALVAQRLEAAGDPDPWKTVQEVGSTWYLENFKPC